MRNFWIAAVGTGVLLAGGTERAVASFVSLDIPANVAPDATAFFLSGSGSSTAAAKDNRISDGIPGQASFDDTYHTLFDHTPGADGHVMSLTWGVPQQLAHLGAYVATNTGSAVEADRKVSSVSFYIWQSAADVNDPTKWTPVGSASAPSAIDVVGGFDLMSIDGYWTNVYGVAYQFQPHPSWSHQGPRVAELTAIVPEPSALLLLAMALVGLAAMRRVRERHCG